MKKKSKGFCARVYSRHSGVTGSCFLVSAHWPDGTNVRFLVDAGAAQGNDNDGFYNCFFPFNTGKIKFILLTHNHSDHMGLLPVTVRQGFKGPIYTSYDTSVLIGLSLPDSCKIIDEYSETPIATREEVDQTLDLIVGCSEKRVIKPHKNIEIRFYPNGHLIGAVTILVTIKCEGEEPINLFFSGDYKDNNEFFDVPMLPEELTNTKISAFFCESTYGDVDSTSEVFEKCLEKNTREALAQGKTVLYPAFAQGRTQEALYKIKCWKESNSIPKNTKVILDGKASQRYTHKYMYSDINVKASMKNFIPPNLIWAPQSSNRFEFREDVFEDESPKIIVSSGGMASYGAITEYIVHYISRENALIHLLGYVSPDSVGYALLHTPYGEKITIDGIEYIKKCEVKKTSELSSHAKRDELLSFIKKFNKIKSVVINHGEEKVQENFRNYLLENLNLPQGQIVKVSVDNAIEITSDGIVELIENHIKSIW